VPRALSTDYYLGTHRLGALVAALLPTPILRMFTATAGDYDTKRVRFCLGLQIGNIEHQSTNTTVILPFAVEIHEHMSQRLKILNIVGARPNLPKIAPLMREMQCHPEIEPILVHTGQHYDEKLSDIFFRQMGIPAPHVNLEVGSGSHAVQTAEVLKRIEPLLIERKPDLVLVVGDVNSTIAVSLAAVKLGVRVAHVKAGLRSFDRSMPEEINRILTDALADYLFVTEEDAIEHLLREGRPREAIHFVGNVMIDSLRHFLPLAQHSTIGDELDLKDVSLGPALVANSLCPGQEKRTMHELGV